MEGNVVWGRGMMSFVAWQWEVRLLQMGARRLSPLIILNISSSEFIAGNSIYAWNVQG